MSYPKESERKPFFDKCPYCGAKIHPTYYHSEGGIEITRMFLCGTVQKRKQEYFDSKWTSTCREQGYNGVM
jgi:hypothetical protein